MAISETKESIWNMLCVNGLRQRLRVWRLKFPYVSDSV